MAREFEVQNAEEFEKLIKSRDFRVYEALVSTVLKNLTSKKRHHHALSVISTDEDAVYDITIDKQDFHHTLEESLKAYEEQEKYEKCAEIKKAMDWLEKKKLKSCKFYCRILGYLNSLSYIHGKLRLHGIIQISKFKQTR